MHRASKDGNGRWFWICHFCAATILGWDPLGGRLEDLSDRQWIRDYVFACIELSPELQELYASR